MTEISNYRCDFCGTYYDSEEKCKKCEAIHKRPVTLELLRYDPGLESGNPYPASVFLKMENDVMVQYDYVGIRADDDQPSKQKTKRKKKEDTVQ